MRLLNSDKLSYDLEDLSPAIQTPSPVLPTLSPETPVAHGPPASAGEEASLVPPETPGRPFPRPLPRSLAQAEDLAPAGAPRADLGPSLSNRKNSLRRLDCVRDLFRRYGKLTRLEIIRAVGISPGTASTDLKVLCEEKFIERITPTPAAKTHYFVLRPKDTPAAQGEASPTL